MAMAPQISSMWRTHIKVLDGLKQIDNEINDVQQYRYNGIRLIAAPAGGAAAVVPEGRKKVHSQARRHSPPPPRHLVMGYSNPIAVSYMAR
jgi:hypothetical protein